MDVMITTTVSGVTASSELYPVYRMKLARC